MEKEKPRLITAEVQLRKQATREITTAEVELYGHIHHGCRGNVKLMFIPSFKKRKKEEDLFLFNVNKTIQRHEDKCRLRRHVKCGAEFRGDRVWMS